MDFAICRKRILEKVDIAQTIATGQRTVSKMDKNDLKIVREMLVRNDADEMYDNGIFDALFEIIDEALAEPTDEAVQKVNNESIRGVINSGEYLATLNDANLADLVTLTNDVQNYINESLVILQAYRTEPCEWVVVDADINLWKCSKCDAHWFFDEGNPKENDMHYCPRCGRDLKGANK